jgi:kynureninase
MIYLDGNSLGALPAATPRRLAEVAEEQWGEDLIASWNKHDWIDWPTRIAAKLGPILGASPDELIIADSTSVCLFKALGAAARARCGRSTILTEEGNFPTDLYVAESVAELLGLKVRTVPAARLEQALDERTAILFLTHVDYRSSARHDLAKLTAAAHAVGALAVWDLSHSAGALELDLRAANADVAVGCGYKYLNGGPGAPAFLYARRDLHEELRSPLKGWMGHAEPFAFEPKHRGASGMAQFLTGTPSILALAALEAGLATFDGVDMAKVGAKARALTSLFIAEVEARCPELRLASPREAADRGAHVSFAHPQAYAVMQALVAQRVVGDFRAPDLLRFGFAPLTTSFEDVCRAAEALAEVLDSRAYEEGRFSARNRVT